MEPEIDIATHIGTQLAAWTLGTNLFHAGVRPADEAQLVPAKACFIYPTGGVEPRDFCGEDRAERRSRLQIWVRGDRGDFTETLALARAIRDTVHRSDATLTDYIQIRAMQSEPIPLGLDDQGLPEYSINIEAFFTE